jgi:hypothetical protein
LSIAAGAAGSLGKLAVHCRRPATEACVWGKAYMPITFPIETIIFGAVAFAAWSAFQRLSRR